MGHDLVIKGGTVVDGSGRPRYRADVGITDGSVAEIGRITDPGEQHIDAEGHFVAPGFIDIHTHLDAQVNWDPLGPAAPHGVTSVIMGNCGFSLAPCREAEKDLVFRSFERSEDIPRESLVEGLQWNWETYGEYLEHLDTIPKAINYGGMVGHSALRTYVMGQRAFDEGSATDEELQAMRDELERSMRAGALGFSSSRFGHHFTADDQPVASRQAPWSEIQALMQVLTSVDRGMFEMTEGGMEAEPDLDEERLQRVQALAIESGRPTIPVEVFADPDRMLRLAEDTATQGGQMIVYATIKPFDIYSGFRIRLPFDMIPEWAKVRALPFDEQRAAFTNAESRAALIEAAQHAPSGASVGAMPRAPEFDRLFVRGTGVGPWPTVAEIAAERQISPLEAMIDLSLETDFEQLFSQTATKEYPEDLWVRKMRHAHTMIGVSDAGAHLSQAVEYTVPTYLMAHWVRGRGVFTWEEAVRRLTFDQASMWGLRGRGLLREGHVADVVVFDPERVGPGATSVVSDLPGGARRLEQRADGIRATVVNGSPVMLEGGRYEGATPGVVLRGGPRRAA